MSQHVFYAEVHNVPGVLSHISGMFSARGFNIKSLTVGETDDPERSRMTVVVAGDDHTMDQVRKQLEKIVTVVKAVDISAMRTASRTPAFSTSSRTFLKDSTDLWYS